MNIRFSIIQTNFQFQKHSFVCKEDFLNVYNSSTFQIFLFKNTKNCDTPEQKEYSKLLNPSKKQRFQI